MADHVPIVEALNAVWPKVRDTTQAMINRAGGKPVAHMHRKVSEQTIWELQRAGRLLSPENTEVIERAKVWADSWGKFPPVEEEEDDKIDIDLYAAIMALTETS